MHGTILVFFVLTAGLSGTFANFLIPLQIGARDMASPFLNMLSYWFFFLASVIMFSSLFVQTGPASGGLDDLSSAERAARCFQRF
jgi:cytochrome c oxidase subunit 1